MPHCGAYDRWIEPRYGRNGQFVIVAKATTHFVPQPFRTQAFRTIGISNPDPTYDSNPNPNPNSNTNT